MLIQNHNKNEDLNDFFSQLELTNLSTDFWYQKIFSKFIKSNNSFNFYLVKYSEDLGPVSTIDLFFIKVYLNFSFLKEETISYIEYHSLPNTILTLE